MNTLSEVVAISDIPYELDLTEKHNSRRWGEKPPPPINEEKTSVKERTFQLAPVGESSEDPATGMEIYPDFDITSGDGVNTFGGQGIKQYTYACQGLRTMAGEECDYKETYHWKLVRTKKKGK